MKERLLCRGRISLFRSMEVSRRTYPELVTGRHFALPLVRAAVNSYTSGKNCRCQPAG